MFIITTNKCETAKNVCESEVNIMTCYSLNIVSMGHAFVYLLLIAICNLIIAQEYTTTSTEITTNTEYIRFTDTPTSSYTVPSKPRELKVLDIFPDTITLSWTSPEKPNGAIDGYRVYYMYGNFTEVQPDQIKYSKPHITYNLTNLSKLTITFLCLFRSNKHINFFL